jgi:hypothetical protein
MSVSRVTPSLSALFTGFFTIGLCGFGGVLPWDRGADRRSDAGVLLTRRHPLLVPG